MITWLVSLAVESDTFSFLRVLEYISVRAALAMVAAFLFCIVAGKPMIAWLRRLKVGQEIRDDQGGDAISLQEMHASKVGTPTMGGLLILGALALAALLFGNWSEPVFQIAFVMALGFGAIGFVDDYRKVSRRNAAGLSGRAKLFFQGSLALAFAAALIWLYPNLAHYEHTGAIGFDVISVPFFKDALLYLGLLYIPFAILVLAGTSNAVNLTDGLDGLAAGVTISATLCFLVVAYLAGRADLSGYLIIHHVQGAGELTVLLAALIGGCFGFLWFNGYPADVFMGDTGSMMIGGLLGTVALLIKQEFLLLIVGGVFVAEALSVIIQVGSYKLRKKRVFLMSPLHHHFERAGVPESRIIVRFWIMSALLALAGLATLKIR